MLGIRIARCPSRDGGVGRSVVGNNQMTINTRSIAVRFMTGVLAVIGLVSAIPNTYVTGFFIGALFGAINIALGSRNAK
jgi:hypothetical protein